MRNPGKLVILSSLVLLEAASAFAHGDMSPFDEFVRGVSIGGDYGTNTLWIKLLPDSWFDYVRSLNANWVGISISMTLEGSMDRTIEECGPNEEFETLEEGELRGLIRALRANGFHVYPVSYTHLTLPTN